MAPPQRSSQTYPVLQVHREYEQPVASNTSQASFIKGNRGGIVGLRGKGAPFWKSEYEEFGYSVCGVQRT